jgi:2,4-dienoyl-CoA reductase-like NADH-dependent reductase (Old Yellow Enzyme family)
MKEHLRRSQVLCWHKCLYSTFSGQDNDKIVRDTSLIEVKWVGRRSGDDHWSTGDPPRVEGRCSLDNRIELALNGNNRQKGDAFMTDLFDPGTIKSMQLRNRIVRSATWEGMCAADGRPSPRLADCYAGLARGGAGLIISGYAFVSPEGKQLPGKMGIHTDDFADDHRRLTGAVHDAGGLLAIQLVHAGGQANPDQIGRKPVAPSAVQVGQFPVEPEELTVAQIHEISAAFGRAAYRAKAWGYDAVQLHGAHGYLINQFLSPLTNRRADDYGGGIENRSRFLREVYEEVRRAVDNEFPVMIKLNAQDHQDGGLSASDAAHAAQMLDAAGIAAIEVSAGSAGSGKLGPVRPKIDTPEKEAYNLELARGIKAKVDCPVMVVGGFRSYAVAQDALQRDAMDYIAMSRPLIREPHLPNRWRNGDHSPAACISCNKCFVPGLKEGGIYCVAEKKEKAKKSKQR